MTSRTRLAVLLLGGAAVLIAVALWFVMSGDRQQAGAGWPPSERAAFMRSCIEECRNSPGVTADKYPLCDTACTCGADEGEKAMSVQELTATARAISSGSASAEQTAKMDRVKAAGMRCVMGSPPAQK